MSEGNDRPLRIGQTIFVNEKDWKICEDFHERSEGVDKRLELQKKQLC